MLIQIHEAGGNDRAIWNRFVDEQGGSFFHYFDWKEVYEFQKRNRYIPLVARNETGTILGIFPVVDQRGPVFPHLSSLPEGDSDGFLLNRGLSGPERDSVLQEFLTHIEDRFSGSHSFFSLRHHLAFAGASPRPSPVLEMNGYNRQADHSGGFPCSYLLDLEKPFREKIFPFMTKNMRNRLRYAKKSGAKIVIDDNFIYFNDFAMMHREMVKKFGIATRKEDYDQFLKVFRKKIRLFICLSDSRPVAGILAYYTPAVVYAGIGPYSDGAKKLGNNAPVLCASIRDACESGYRWYDLGITRTASLAAYKERFGARKVPLILYQKKFSAPKMLCNKLWSFGKSVSG